MWVRAASAAPQRSHRPGDNTGMIRILFGVVIGCVCAQAAGAETGRGEIWLYYPTNLQVDANVEKAREVWGRAAKAGYTHVLLADAKMARLGDLQGMEKTYFRNV